MKSVRVRGVGMCVMGMQGREVGCGLNEWEGEGRWHGDGREWSTLR